MALSLRAASGGNQAATSATSQAITLPTGTAANDIVYFVVSVGIGTVSGASTTVGSGWTLTTTTDATGATSTIVGYKTVGASETAPTVSWTNAGRVAWTAIAIAPGAGNTATHSLFATPSNTGTAATTKTPPATTAVAGNTSVILTGARTSANANGTLLITSPPTNWTEPTNGDQGTSSGNARQQAAEISYRLGLSSGAVTPSAESFFIGATATSSYAIVHHALITEGTAYAQTITDAAGATDSNTPVLTSPPAASTLTDDFATKDTAKWTWDTGAGVSGGQLVLPCTSSYDGEIFSANQYNLVGSSASVQVVSLPVVGNGGPATYYGWYVDDLNTNSVFFYLTGGNLLTAYRVAGATTVPDTIAYDPATTPYLRIADSGGTLLWQTSANGTSWTTVSSWTYTLNLSLVYAQIGTGYGGTETAPGNAVFDNFNLTPTGTNYSQTITDAAGAADSVIYSPISSLTSDFASMPAFFDGNFGGPAVTAGELHVPTIGSYAAAATVGRYRFIGDSVYAKVVTASGTSGTRQNSIKLEVDSANSVEMIMDGGAFAGRIQTAGANVDTALGTYNATTHAWWRIRESAGTIFWDTSLDGTTWTNRGSSSHTLNFASTRLLLQAGYYGTETAPPDAVYDNLNTPGAIAYSQTITDAAGAVDATSRAASFSQTVTDVAGAVDTASSASSYAPTLTDSAGATDATSSALTATQTVTDAAGATDSVATSTARTITDVAGATDTATSALTAAQTITDAAGATDAAASTLAAARTLTDAAGATDAAASTLAAARTLTDAAGATDAAASALAAAQTVTDVAGAADLVAAVLSVTLTDAAGAVDSAATTATYAPTLTDQASTVDSATTATTRTLTDVAGATDATSSTASYAPTLTDPAGAVDSVATATTRTLTDAAGATDSVSSTASYAPTLTDAAGAADTTTSALTVAATLTDAAGTTDTATSALAAAQTITDVAGAADSAGQAAISARTVTDAADATDTASPTLAAAQTVTDVAGATDTTSPALTAAQTITDAAGATDSATSALAAAPTLTDAAGAVDATATTANYAPTVTDPAGAADAVQVSGTGQTQIVDSAGAVDTLTQASASTRTLNDAAGATDAVAASITRTLTDSAGAADTVAASTARTLTDAAGATDTLAQASVGARTITDAADAVDTVTASSGVARTVTDTASAADAVSQSAASDVAQTVTDVAGASDTVAAVRDLSIVVTDAVGVVDTADRVVAAQRVLADAAEIVDSAAYGFAVAITLLDAVGVADGVVAHAGELGWVSAARAPGSGLVAARRVASGLRATRTDLQGLTANRVGATP